MISNKSKISGTSYESEQSLSLQLGAKSRKSSQSSQSSIGSVNKIRIRPKKKFTNPDSYVTKWVDYTNKYGFGYLMGSGIMGIIFNDNTKITTKVPFDINEDPT